MREMWARLIFGLTAVLSLTGVTMSAVTAAGATAEKVAAAGGAAADPATFATAADRFLNTFAAFTIWSNIIGSVVCIFLAINPHRRSTVFRIFRLYGLISITTTGLVYNFYLAGLAPEPQGWSAVANDLVHRVTPLLLVGAWLVFGPRIPFRMKYIGGCVAIGVAWVTFTLTRGAIINWYTYPFVDVGKLGYPVVLLTCVGILAVAALMGMGIMGLDKKLPGLSAENSDTDPSSGADNESKDKPAIS